MTRYAPTTTYRLQFGSHFSFVDALRLLPYLEQIGITDCYTSPLLKASAGSQHGYDIVDHCALNPELGTEADFDTFALELRARAMGLILDFVPNHMGLDASANHWWRDVLQHGQASPFADYFDIDWDPLTPELKGRILLPILQDGYGEVLERGELTLAFESGELQLHYFDRRLPIEPGTALLVLTQALVAREELTPASAAGRSDSEWHEYADILAAMARLPPLSVREPGEQRARHDATEHERKRLASLVKRSAPVRAAIERVVACFN